MTALQKSLGIQHTSQYSSPLRMKLNYCMADMPSKNIVITPDGSFNHCEHLPEADTWGNIFDGVTNPTVLDRLHKPVETDAQCEKCPFLPKCTPFYKNGCPIWFASCNKYQKLVTEHSLHTLLMGADIEEITDTEEL